MSNLSEAELTDIWNRKRPLQEVNPDYTRGIGRDSYYESTPVYMTDPYEGSRMREFIADLLESGTTKSILNEYEGKDLDKAQMKKAGMATQPDIFKVLNPFILGAGFADAESKRAFGQDVTFADRGWAAADVLGLMSLKPAIHAAKLGAGSLKAVSANALDKATEAFKAKLDPVERKLIESHPDFRTDNLLEFSRKYDPEARLNMGQHSLVQKNDKRAKQAQLKLLNQFGREEWGNLFKSKKGIYTEEVKQAMKDGTLHMIPWYSGRYSKVVHLVDMIHTSMVNSGEAKHMLDSVDSFFTPNVLEELDHIGRSHGRAKSGSIGDRTPTNKLEADLRDRQANIFNDQIGHILATLEMYYPHHAKTQQMRNVYGKYIFPEYSNGGKLMNTADVGVQTVKDVLGPHMKGALADPRSIQSHLIDSGWFTGSMKDKLYLGSSKAISGMSRIFSHLSDMSSITAQKTGKIKNTGWAGGGLNSWKGKLPIMQDVFNALDSWHLNPNKPELTKEYIWKQLELKNKEYEKLYQANMENWLETGSSFKKWSKETVPSWMYPDKLTRKPKLRVYNKEDVMKNLQIDNGLVSVGQEFLSEDILLATIRARGVWNINDPKNGAILLGDSYQQGAGIVDKVLGIGTDVNRFFYDIIPWNSRVHKIGKGGETLKTEELYHHRLPPEQRMVEDHLWGKDDVRGYPGMTANEIETLSRGPGDSTVGLSVAPGTGQYWETSVGPMKEAIGMDAAFFPPKKGLPSKKGDKSSGLLKIDDYWGNNLLQ